MASLRPRRGKKTTAESENIVLKEGEVFFETPESGSGTGKGKIKMGDGISSYSDLPYYLEETNVSESEITFTKRNIKPNTLLGFSTISDCFNRFISGARLNMIISCIEALLDHYINNAFVTIDDVYPVGSIYTSILSTNPAEIFGAGTWEQITDGFLLSAGDTYTNGTTGGSASNTLSTANMPSHTHSMSHTHTTAASTSHSGDGHQHSIPTLSGTAASAGAHQHLVDYAKLAGKSTTDRRTIGTSSFSNSFVESDGAHIHSVTTNASTTGSNGAHTHTFSNVYTNSMSTITTGASGSATPTAVNNMPPYLTVYMWKRTA